MAEIPINNIKGLFLDADTDDLSLEHVTDLTNFCVRPGYVETDAYSITDRESFDYTVIQYAEIKITDDHVRKTVPETWIKDVRLAIVNVGGYIRIMYKESGGSWITPTVEYDGEIPACDSGDCKIINTDGVAVITTPTRMLWFGWFCNPTSLIEGYKALDFFNITYSDARLRIDEVAPAGSTVVAGVTASVIWHIDGQDENEGDYEPIKVFAGDTIYHSKVFLKKSTGYIAGVGIAQYQVDMFYEDADGNNPTHISELGYHLGGGASWNRYPYARSFPRSQSSPGYLQSSSDEKWLEHFDDNGVYLSLTIGQVTVNSYTGFQTSTVELLLTAVIDDKYEIPCAVQNISFPNETDYNGLKITITPLNGDNSRITKWKVYAKERPLRDVELDVNEENEIFEDMDYQEIYEVDLLSDYYNDDQMEKILLRSHFKGVYFAQNSGFTYDKRTYKLLEGFNDIQFINGIGYILYNGSVYHSSIGGGSILHYLFHKVNKLPIVFKKTALKLANFNESLGVCTKDRVEIVNNNVIEDQLFHKKERDVNLQIGDTIAFSEVPGGVIAISKAGIFYISSSEDVKNLAIPILSLIESNYSTAEVYTHHSNNEVFVRLNSSASTFYRYSFKYDSWSLVELADGKIFAGSNGELLITRENAVSIASRTSGTINSTMSWGNRSFGSDLYKELVAITIQYEWLITNAVGSGRKVTITLGSTTVEIERPQDEGSSVGIRYLRKYFVYLNQRVPFTTEILTLSTNTPVKIHGIKLELSPVGMLEGV
jgi:hypothetical protein